MPSTSATQKTNIVVACTNASGDPDLFFFVLDGLDDDAIDDGGHYDAAKQYALTQGYEAPMVVFDGGDMSDALDGLFAWDTATVVQYADIQ